MTLPLQRSLRTFGNHPAGMVSALSLVLVILASAAPAAADPEGPQFTSVFRTFGTASSRALAIGDLTRDGIPDLVVDGAPSWLQVLVGRRDGTFEPGATIDGGFAPYDVEIADLNADGRPDLAVTDIDHRVMVLLGQPNGTFAPRTVWRASRGRQEDVDVADLDRDGRLDLVVAGPDGVTVLLGNGDGSFTPRTDLVGEFNAIAVGDLNRDGIPDIAAAGIQVPVLLGRGDGTFESVSTPFPHAGTSFSSKYSALDIGDLNGDGIPDLAACDYDRAIVSVALGNGDGSFTLGHSFGTAQYPLCVAIGDVDGDSRPDLVTSGGVVSVLRGAGDGTFAARREYATGGTPYTLRIADVDRDGHPDLAVAVALAGASVLYGNGDGTFGAKTVYTIGGRPYAIAIADFDGDGKPDIAAACSPLQSTGFVSVLLGHGDGTFARGGTFEPGGVSLASADLNGDGKPDLVTTGFWDHRVSVLIGNGDGTFTRGADATTAGFPQGLALGDLNADGRVDAVIVNSNPEIGSVLLGNGDGTFAPRQDFRAAETYFYPVAVALGDLNGDRNLDVVVADGNTRIAVLFGNGDGTLAPPTAFSACPGGNGGTVALGALDRDGSLDMAVGGGFCGAVSTMMGTGDGGFVRGPDLATGRNQYFIPTSIVIADLDLDGRSDVLFTDRGRNGVLVLAGRGNGTFGPMATYGTGVDPHSLALGDFNRDGKPDLAVANSYSGTVAVLINLTRTRGGPRNAPASGVEPDVRGPFSLESVIPSPARGPVRVGFMMGREARGRISVLDVTGRRVAVLGDGLFSAGHNEVTWDPGVAGHVAPVGLYFVRFEWPGGHASRRLVLAH